MILSFHPCFEADKNIICAGRLPDKSDLHAIKNAKAVILPQGCTKELHQMVFSNCKNVFPNFNARFLYPGKTGQIKLFKLTKIPHPESWEYASVNELLNNKFSKKRFFEKNIPFVFKFDWGGEGETVFLVKTKKVFNELLNKARIFEEHGHCGFLIQKYIKSFSKTLRVLVIGNKIISYWKIQNESSFFGEHISKGAYIEKNVDQAYMIPSINIVNKFCSKTKINLAGFDFIFSKKNIRPFLLEINYFFGRRGLGGSEQYYKLLCSEIYNWITSLNLSNILNVS